MVKREGVEMMGVARRPEGVEQQEVVVELVNKMIVEKGGENQRVGM